MAQGAEVQVSGPMPLRGYGGRPRRRVPAGQELPTMSLYKVRLYDMTRNSS